MDVVNRGELLEELRSARERQQGKIYGRMAFECSHTSCPVQQVTLTVRERAGGRLLQPVMKCCRCGNIAGHADPERDGGGSWPACAAAGVGGVGQVGDGPMKRPSYTVAMRDWSIELDAWVWVATDDTPPTRVAVAGASNRVRSPTRRVARSAARRDDCPGAGGLHCAGGPH
jgi:hypothetical protein